MLKIKNIELQSRVLLAPMAGVTDLPYRSVVRSFGNFLTFSEMIASEAMIRHVKRTHRMLDSADIELNCVQIVGANPKSMSDAARLCEDMGAKMIDINMGCPVKKVVKSEAGAALMRDEKLAIEIIRAVVAAVNVPVSIKMRLGWDHENKNAACLASTAEDLGVSLITVHGRTRSQFYSGNANWADIRKVKEAVKTIPIIANGDIACAESALKCLEGSKADGVMIARGSMGRPWILRCIHDAVEGNPEFQEPNSQKKYEITKNHIENVLGFYPIETAVKLCRKILMYYCKNVFAASKLRQKITSVDSETSVYETLEKIFL